MKNIYVFIAAVMIALSVHAQINTKKDVFQRVNNTSTKVLNSIAVFQPYLLKARQLFYDAKQLKADVRNTAKNTFGKNKNATDSNANNVIYTNANSNQTTFTDTSGGNSQTVFNSNFQSSTGDNTTNNNPANTNFTNTQSGNNQQANNSSPQNYLLNQSLPINNDASVNNDGTGNWGNQNNGLYGNCLDALTGTVMGMGEASATPTFVDLMFFAPADGQNTYYILTPGFARNDGTVSYWTNHISDQVLQWSDVNETEVALTKLTLGQFDQIRNNSQVVNAVRNAQNYAGYYSSVGQKLDGQVLAVKAQLENREVYALIAIIKQFGTSGNNGYLKIKIKAQGIDANGDGKPDAGQYQSR